VREIEIK
jgi:hypothetical protein